MILSDIRYLVGIHVAEKGLPPTVVAPMLNILNLLDTHLSTIGISIPPEVLKEAERLNHAIVLLNTDDDEEFDDDDFDIEDEVEDDDDGTEDEFDDDDFDDDDDEDDDEL